MKSDDFVIIPKKFIESFEDALIKYRIVFLSALSGYGKTTMCRELLMYQKTYNISDIFNVSDMPKDTKYIIFDNLQLQQSDEQITALVNLINENPRKQFVLMSRANLPYQLLRFEMEGLLFRINMSVLRFSPSDVMALFSASNLMITEKEAQSITQLLFGNAMALKLLAKRRNIGTLEDQDSHTQIKWLAFQYMDTIIFENLDEKSKKILIHTAYIDSFSVDLVYSVLDVEDAQSVMSGLVNNTILLQPLCNERYKCIPEIAEFLRWKVKQLLPRKAQIELYNKVGAFYELRKDYVNAIIYFNKAENEEKVIELLEICALFNVAYGFFRELEVYFKKLTEEQVLESTSLIVGMAMLCVLRVDYNGADYWYRVLEEKSRKMNKKSAEYKDIYEKLIYLDLACPHREISSIQEILNMLFQSIKRRGIKMTQLSISSSLPTVLNGGRDFSEWVKIDDIIYKTMKAPVEHVLKSQGVGLLTCGYCESKFEKAMDYHSAMVEMTATLHDIQHRGTIDTEFVLVGVLARIQLSQGKPNSARETLLEFEKKLEKENHFRLIPNLKAMLCHISLCCGDMQAVERWLTHDAPSDLINIWILWRLQYRVKSEVLISQGHYQEAIILLSQLSNYAEKCNKVLDYIHFHVLTAIANYRMCQKNWDIYLKKAIDISAKYGYITPISQYGKAVLPLLMSIKYTDYKLHFEKLVKHTRIQASFYQHYLDQSYEIDVRLSNMEHQVLALICQDRSNQEIADILGIKLTTVKTHVSNILRKLDIKRRSEAKTEAKRRNLIEDYLAV